MLELTITLSIFLSAFLLGGAAFRLFAPHEDGGSFAVSVGLGLGILSLLIFGSGLLGLYGAKFFALLLAALSVLSIRPFIGALKRALARLPGVLKDKTAVLLAAAILAAGTLNIVSTYLPATDSDSLTYHLTAQKYYLEAGRIHDISKYIKYSTFPQLTETLYAPALALGGETAAQQVHLLFGLLTAFLVYAFLRPKVTSNYALAGALLYLVSQPVFELAGTAMIDLALAFHFAAAFWCFFRWMESRGHVWLGFAFTFLAFSFGAKYTGALALLLVPVFLSGNPALKEKGFGPALILSLAISFALVLPWLLRNWAFVSNPFSPFLAGIFKDTSMDAAAAANLEHHLGSIRGEFSAADRAGFFLKTFYDNPEAAIAALFLFFRNRPSYLKYTFICAVAYLALSDLFLPHIYRFNLPAFPLLFAGAAGSLALFGSKKAKTALVAALAAVVLARFFALGQKVFRPESLPYLTGKETKEEYLSRNLDYYSILPEINSELSKDDIVLSLNENRGYYFRPKLAVAGQTPLTSFVFEEEGAEGFARAALENGIRYVFVNNSEYFRPRTARPDIPVRLIDAGLAEMIMSNGVCELYELRAGGDLLAKTDKRRYYNEMRYAR
ncbi:MAG: glycosyltransferase family 39 protein [Endomicrobiales bacterium]|nr:glycosyltransferase family 39 protein [Endomicrobiales bacterium]